MRDTTRRTLVTSAPIAALAPLARSANAASGYAQADLWGLKAEYDRTWKALRAAYDNHSPAEAAHVDEKLSATPRHDRLEFTARRLADAERAVDIASDANMRVVERIAKMPARTIEGLKFKAQVSIDNDHHCPEIIDSLIADIMNMSNTKMEI